MQAETGYTWDQSKAFANERKHGVSFEEALSAFRDPRCLVIPDPDHSEVEDRFLLLGISPRLRVLVVCHCYREAPAVVRIISARKATATERAQYLRG